MSYPLRKVVKSEWTGACRYTGYIDKTLHIWLECGHDLYRKGSQGVPKQARCLDCADAEYKREQERTAELARRGAANW